MINLEHQAAGVKTQLVIEDSNRFILNVTVCLSVKKEIYNLYWDKLASKPGFIAQLQITNIRPKISKNGKNHYLKVFYRREESSKLPIDCVRLFVDRCKRRTYETLRYLLEEEYKMWKQMQMPEQLNMDL